MDEIIVGKHISEISVPVFFEESNEACGCEFTVGAGSSGDSLPNTRYSGITYMSLDEADRGANFQCRINGEGKFEKCKKIEILLGGTAERFNFIAALEFILKTLKSKHTETNNMEYLKQLETELEEADIDFSAD